ncbi:uncharacterized protein [Littorina saxatilis]|uniref:uncharacterized protein n=1 Tax=Littorina saxatilis TaxID=31220 RepID=UPI0038B4E824
MLISTYLLVHLLSTMCDPAPSAENAEENTAEPSSSAKYNLRIKLKRPVNCSYEEDEEDEGDGEISAGENLTEWQKKLRKHEEHGTMEAFRKKEKERHQLYQQSTTSEKRAIIREQVTQKEGGVISGRYLKPWGAAWKFSDALSFVEEYQIPLQDIGEKMDSAVLHDDGRNIYYTF